MAPGKQKSAQNSRSWPIKIENDLNAEQFNFLAELTPYCIEARYGDHRESLSEIINEQRAREVYAKTQEIFQWLYQKID